MMRNYKFNQLIIVGAGGFAREIEAMLDVNHYFSDGNDILFYVDSHYVDSARQAVNREGFRDRVISRDWLNAQDEAFVPDMLFCIGDPFQRCNLVEFVTEQLPSHRFACASIRDKSSYMGHHVIAQDGFIGCPFSVFTTNINIGKHCHFNLHVIPSSVLICFN